MQLRSRRRRHPYPIRSFRPTRYLASCPSPHADHGLLVVHADLGRVEWKGTKELAQRQAEFYGLRFEVVRRDKGDLLDQVKARRMWPSSNARYCTSDQKTSQVHKLFTKLAKESRTAGLEGPVRIVSCLGIRAQESPALNR